jgi:hypothetical protein
MPAISSSDAESIQNRISYARSGDFETEGAEIGFAVTLSWDILPQNAGALAVHM